MRVLRGFLLVAVFALGLLSSPAWSACLTSTLVISAPPYTNSQCITPPVNNDGIDSTGSTYTLNNSGAITVQGTVLKGSTSADGINAQTTGDLTVINTGALSATSSGTGSSAAIQAFPSVIGPTGTTTVTNGGPISLFATGGNLAGGISAEANQILFLTNNSTITGTASNGFFQGLIGTTGNGSCNLGICTPSSANVVTNISNSGIIDLNAAGSMAISASSVGSGSSVINITNTGAITVNGAASAAIAPFAQLWPVSCPIATCVFLPGVTNVSNQGQITAGPNAYLFFSSFLQSGNNLITNTGTLDGQFRNSTISSSSFTENDLANQGLFYISYPGAGLPQIIDGNFTQTPSGTLGLRINAAGQSDFLTARSVNLGGTLLAIMQPGNYANTTFYPGVVQSTAPITTRFSNVESDNAFFLPTATYNNNTVDLTLTREAFGLLPGLTFNERAVGNALEAGYDRGATNGPGASIYAALFGLQTVQQAASAYDQLSGEIHASAQSVILDQSLYARDAMLGRMRQFQFDFGGTDGALVSLGGAGPALAYAEFPGSADMLALGYTNGTRPPFPIKAPPARGSEPDLVYWAQGVADWGRLGGDGNAATVTDTLGGFFGGFDKRFGGWRAGILLGYTGADASIPARGSSANVNTAHFGAYAGTGWGAWRLRTGGELAWSELSTDRSIIFPGFTDSATSRYGANEGQVFGEFGYGMSFGRIAAEPFGGLAAVTLHTDSFSESGGVAALDGSSNNATVGYSTLGARAATTFDWRGMALTPRVSAAWQHAFGDVTPSAALSFQTIGTAFTVAGVPIARDAALVDAGAELTLNPNATIGIAYVGQLSGRDQDNSVNGTFRWKF